MKIDPSIFKAYDIRGIYPDTLNEEIAYKIGQGYVEYAMPKGEVLVGMDVRIYSPVIKDNIINGITDAGVDVVDVGLMSTDMLYFGVGFYKTNGGLQATASHNPPEWHGVKMVKKGPVPMTLEDGISQIRDFVISNKKIEAEKKGTVRTMDIWNDFADYILTYIKGVDIKPMKIVINPNFGLAGKILERIVERGKLPITLVKLNAEPDGHFPKGRPDPFIPENRTEFLELVKSSGADLGITWDADADRVFFSAEGGVFLQPYYLNTILIKQMLKINPGEKILYDPRYTWGLIDAISSNGGVPMICRVGHSYIKQMMRKENAIFAGESSGHTYFRDYWFSDSGMIPVMMVLKHLSESSVSLLSEVEPYMDKYFMSDEINTVVKDKEGKMDEIAEKYKDGKQSRLDGIAVEYPEYRFCVRPSNTESLLRLTLEAKSKELMEQKRDEILAIIRT